MKTSLTLRLRRTEAFFSRLWMPLMQSLLGIVCATVVGILAGAAVVWLSGGGNPFIGAALIGIPALIWSCSFPCHVALIDYRHYDAWRLRDANTAVGL